jgi:hypothetical protein
LVLQSKNLRKQLEQLAPGDLVSVDWCDASVGKSLGSGVAVDVPVQSWGIFIGVLGEKNKHIVLAQNSFRYSDGLFDIDYTAIPLSWTANINVIVKGHVEPKAATILVNSFLMGGRRAFRERKIQQQSVKNHG